MKMSYTRNSGIGVNVQITHPVCSAKADRGSRRAVATGRPTAWERAKADMTWCEFACACTDMKWKQAFAKYGKDIARALSAATPVMLADARGRPSVAGPGQSSMVQLTAPDDVLAPVGVQSRPHVSRAVVGKVLARSAGPRHAPAAGVSLICSKLDNYIASNLRSWTISSGIVSTRRVMRPGSLPRG
jgi:hypothetical protein